ncbi:hypothetical protein GF340_00155 [Candidatus Peregrinibacteria bacterium]|nr:hypothetical protein [Candidatus Peregrinibacteria bacterium]
MKKISKKHIITFIAVSLVHFVGTFFTMVSSLGYTLSNFDNPSNIDPTKSDIFSNIIGILTFPLLPIFQLLNFENNIIQFTVIILNSMLWGFVLTAIFFMLTGKKKAKQS